MMKINQKDYLQCLIYLVIILYTKTGSEQGQVFYNLDEIDCVLCSQ